jgi:hypothetical protein
MLRLSFVVLAVTVMLLPAYADNEPITLSTSGAFSGAPSVGSIDSGIWYYDGNPLASSGTVAFTGALSQSGTTNITSGCSDYASVLCDEFEFGTITIDNNQNPNSVDGTASLDVTVDFTVPSVAGQLFTDSFTLNATVSGRSLTLSLAGLPGSTAFVAGGEQYTITYDAVSQGSTGGNGPGNSLNVDLLGAVTSVEVAEPGPVPLLVTMLLGLAGLAGVLKRKLA